MKPEEKGEKAKGTATKSIFVSLQKLLGKSKPMAVKGLSWTLLRSIKANVSDVYTQDTEAMTEHHSKLCVAASVLHECFVPIIEPRTKRDLVMDVLFNKRSELRRLNFGGFYTMVLERGDELITVAVIRILGEKVAEIPLVATRVQYRRQGMCRLLLNELEKMLSNLGVERLLLPAAPQLLETWTSSFGFAKMTSSDRMKLLEHTFLEFQDTTMCQKILKPSTLRTESIGTKFRSKLHKSNDEMDSNGYGAKETVQAEEPITILDAVHVQECVPDVAIGGENSSHSSLSGAHGLCPIPLIQESQQIEQIETLNAQPQDSDIGEDSNIHVLTEVIYPFRVEHVVDVKCKFQGLCYRRNGKTGMSKSCLFNSLDQHKDLRFSNETFKYYSRRRTSASEKLSGSFVS